jgi:hypothetical protein
MVGLQGATTLVEDDPYGKSGLFSGGGGWRNNTKRNYGGMFGEEDGGEGGLFNTPAPVNQGPTRTQAPIVSNGLFGGNALKDDEADSRPGKTGGAKLNSIFDYEEVDDAPPQ